MRYGLTLGFLLAVALPLATAGCTTTQSESGGSGPNRPSPGRENRLEFSSTRDTGGTQLIPFMTGGERRVTIMPIDEQKDGDVLARESNPQFVSGDPAVFTTDVSLWIVSGNQDGSKDHGLNLRIKALKAGTAELRVLDGAGALVDRVDITVTDPVRVAVGDEKGNPVPELSLSKAAKPVKITGLAYGPGDAPLDADQGFKFASGDEALLGVTASCTTFICFGDTGNNVYLGPKAEGRATVKVETANGISATVPVTIGP